MATRHSFSKARKALNAQLAEGIRGLDFIVHSRPVAAAASTATASLAGLAVGAGAGYARPELVLGKAFPGDDVRVDRDTPDEALVTWLSAVARWSESPAGREATPVTLWLSLAEDVLGNGAELCDVNAAVAHAFGPPGTVLFTPDELATRFHGVWPKVDDLNGRVLVVLGGARQPRMHYHHSVCQQQGRCQPSVAMNGSGIVVAVCESPDEHVASTAAEIVDPTADTSEAPQSYAVGGGTIVVAFVGQYIPAVDEQTPSHVVWHARRRIGFGTAPSVAITDSGAVIAVFQGLAQWELQCCIGRVGSRPGFQASSPMLDVFWGVPAKYSSGCRPTVAVNALGTAVIAVHTREAFSDSLGWRTGRLATPQQPDEIPRIEWDSSNPDQIASGGKNLTLPRGAEPSAVARFDPQVPTDVLVSITYKKVGAAADSSSGSRRGGSERILGLIRRGSAPTIPRNSSSPNLAHNAGDVTARSVPTPSGSPAANKPAIVVESESDFDDEMGTAGLRRTIVRGVVSDRRGEPAAATADSPQQRPVVIWQRGIDLDQQDDLLDTSRADLHMPERHAATVSDGGDSELRVSVASTSSGRLVCRCDRGAEAPLRLQQLCFVEAHRDEDELLADSEVRFAGCVARDAEFAAKALAAGRIVRMWRFNQPACLRSAVNPNFPFTDGPDSDWYASYIDACGGRPLQSR